MCVCAQGRLFLSPAATSPLHSINIRFSSHESGVHIEVVFRLKWFLPAIVNLVSTLNVSHQCL